MTAKQPRKVALVAFARTSRHLAPYDDPSWEIWGLNEGYRFQWMQRWDRWFQLHPYWNFTRSKNMNDPNHWKWLQNLPYTQEEVDKIFSKPNTKARYDPPPMVGGPRRRTDFPIYMQEAYEEVPGSVKYPKDEVCADLGIEYLTSTVSEMVALAIYEKVDVLGLWGIEMATNTEWRYQRPGGEFMLGFAMGRGIKIIMPEHCGMLRGKTYGWEALPMVGRQELEMYYMRLKKDEDGALAQLNCALGAMQELEDLLKKDPENEKAKTQLEEVKRDVPAKQQILNQVLGAKLVITDLIHRVDMQEEEDISRRGTFMYLGGEIMDKDLRTGPRGDEDFHGDLDL